MENLGDNLITHDQFISLIELSQDKETRGLADGIAFGLLGSRSFPTNDELLNYYVICECDDGVRNEYGRSDLNDNVGYIIDSWSEFWNYVEKWPAFNKEVKELFETK